MRRIFCYQTLFVCLNPFTPGRSELISRSVGPRPPPLRGSGPLTENKNKLENSQNQPAREALRAADLMWGCVPTPILI